MSWFSGARTRLHLLLSRRAAESRMDREIAFHIEMETDLLVRDQHLPPDEARRRALVAFGGVARHKEALRDGRGLAWLGGLRLDMTLGLRMLRKYPGLTIVGGMAMAFAIWVGAVTFEVTTLFVRPSLPLPDGDRIVLLRNWDIEASDPEPRAVHDFIAWRSTLSSVTDLGAYRDVVRNLITAGGISRPVYGAEVTASAFRIAPTQPLLGRVLQPADELPGAPPVVILGYDVWRARFAGDSRAIGHSVQLGETHATVVGVMPEGFKFPVSHELWTQLRPEALDRTPRAGPAITMFGRLAPGVSLEAAQSELTMLGQRMATELPGTHEHLQPGVAPYAKGFQNPGSEDLGIMASIYIFALMLVVLVCSNVALLLFARAATRENELAVRSALGASRGRIVTQLFAEALVLGSVAGAIGLAAAALALRTWGVTFLEANLGRVPFWIDPSLSPATVVYAVCLTILSAVIAGALPGLKITRGLGTRLRQATAGGGVRFGGVWTVVVIAQVAVTVAFPAIVFIEQRELQRVESFDVGFKAEEYLGVLIEMDAAGGASPGDSAAAAAQQARYGAAVEDLRRRVATEPGVAGVTFVDRLPRMFHRERFVEVDLGGSVRVEAGAATGAVPSHEVSTALIDPSYFDVLKTPILAGRAFDRGDVAVEPQVAIVDQAFVDRVLQGRNPIGRQVRFVADPRFEDDTPDPPGPWYEIVGVAKDLGMTYFAHQHRAAGVYLPAAPATAGPLYMVVHAQRDPSSIGPRVRELTAAVDPMLRLSNLQRLDQVADVILWVLRLWLRVSLVLTAVALLLSLAGIYAVLAFNVARRTREIGVRVALGASRRGVVTAIFRRPLTNVGIGVAIGGVLIALGAVAATGGDGGLARVEGGFSLLNVVLLLAYASLMMGVCLLACIVPTRRALSVEPTEALRAE